MNDSKPRVLVVDDDTLMREVLKAILRDEGFAVAGEAKDGQSAIALVESSQPDAVFLDVNMPGISGLETLKVLRERFPQVRVIMVTGDASMETVREAVSHGAIGFIIKPFKAGRVGDSVRAALKASSDATFG